jgi:hypothetical protein
MKSFLYRSLARQLEAVQKEHDDDLSAVFAGVFMVVRIGLSATKTDIIMKARRPVTGRSIQRITLENSCFY